MAGPDLPFPNNARSHNSSFLGIRFARRKGTILLLVFVCLFFVIWFNSDLSYGQSSSINLPEEGTSEKSTSTPNPLEGTNHKIEENIEEIITTTTTTTTTTAATTTTTQTVKPTTASTAPKTPSSSKKSNTVAKLVAQHYKYFIVIGSRASQSSRRQLIRETYFGVHDNIEPCMKRDKGLGYLFYIYGDEPTPKTPERRSYETEKMEYNDLEKVNTDRFNQDDILKWVNTELSQRGVTYDYLIIQDGYSIIQLNYIQQQIQAEVGQMWRINKTSNDLLWVSPYHTHQSVLVAGSDAVQKLLDNEENVKNVMVDDVNAPLMSHYYEYYRSIQVQLNFVSARKEVDRLQNIIHELPLFINNKDRFQVWRNVVESLPDMTITVSNVYQDSDFTTIATAFKIGAASLCKPLEKASIAVVTSSYIYPDSCMEASASLAADNKREYAVKHNYAFVARSNEFVQQDVRTEKRRPVWGKIDAVQKVLPKYDWIFWMDMDAVIMDPEQTVQRILDDLRQKYDTGPRDFENNIDLVIAKPKRDKMINAGVFFLRNTEWAQTFLNKVQETTEWFNRGPSYEQGAMWDIIQLPGFKEHVLLLENDDHTFNTFPSLYVPGDFIVHFAPDKCPGPAVLNGLEAAKRIQQGETVTSFEVI